MQTRMDRFQRVHVPSDKVVMPRIKETRKIIPECQLERENSDSIPVTKMQEQFYSHLRELPLPQDDSHLQNVQKMHPM